MTEKAPDKIPPNPPAAEAGELERLRQENSRLRAQLAAAGRPAGVAAPVHTFQLSEGNRQELLATGVTNVGGRQVTVAEARKEMGPDQDGVPLDGAPDPELLPARPVTNVPGVDFVYPSVTRGKIDPEVAGTPGISGPPAGKPAGR